MIKILQTGVQKSQTFDTTLSLFWRLLSFISLNAISKEIMTYSTFLWEKKQAYLHTRDTDKDSQMSVFPLS